MTEKQENTVVLHDRYRYMDFDRNQCSTLAKELGLPFPCAVLLWQRGIRNTSAAEEFLAPRLTALPSPFLLQDMEKGVSIIHQALQENWPIYIHGDYDVDGITASALLSRFFAQIGKKTTCYQPDRLTEGYGLQESFIRAKAPITGKEALLITVDCGISDFKEVSLAKEMGFRVIVTDHHLPGETLPSADAVINPQRQDCSFPFSSLAGVGVAFFFAYAIRNSLVEKGELKKEEAPNLKKLMDLVALGTVADVMPLVSVNRILVRAGLEVMNQPDCLWVKALRKQQQNNFNEGVYTSEDISYRFAPRINAPGRLGMPSLAFELLSSNSEGECEELAVQIEEMNQQRREHEIGTLEQVIEACKIQDDKGAQAFVVEGDFHQGVIGIIASRIVDLYQKPVIIFTEDTSRLGAFKGSGRSVEGINLYDALKACSKAIIQFGGHAMAAGLAIHKDNLQFFTKQFQAAVEELSQQHKTISKSLIPVDFPAKPEEVLHKSFLEKYHHLQPFGNGNLEPVFLAENPQFAETAVVKNNHLTFSLKINGQIFRGIGFGMADKLSLIRKGPFQFAYKIKNTVYKGDSRVEIHAVDISPTT